MNESNEKKLLKDFSHLYRRYRRPTTETSMRMGFQCGDGWFNLIYDLSQKIEARLKEEPADFAEQFAVEQVKEKFGILTYSASGGSEAISRLIREARARSAKTCEACGKPGQLRRKKGFRQETLCDFCDAKTA